MRGVRTGLLSKIRWKRRREGLKWERGRERRGWRSTHQRSEIDSPIARRWPARKQEGEVKYGSQKSREKRRRERPSQACKRGFGLLWSERLTVARVGFGVNIPPTTNKLVGTKADILKGRGITSPLSSESTKREGRSANRTSSTSISKALTKLTYQDEQNFPPTVYSSNNSQLLSYRLGEIH